MYVCRTSYYLPHFIISFQLYFIIAIHVSAIRVQLHTHQRPAIDGSKLVCLLCVFFVVFFAFFITFSRSCSFLSLSIPSNRVLLVSSLCFS